MIRFVGNDAEGRPLKRKQSQRACEQCRKRKKRCVHQSSTPHPEPSTHGTESASSPRRLAGSAAEIPKPTAHVELWERQEPHDDGNRTLRRSIQQPQSPVAAHRETSIVVEDITASIDEEDEDNNPRFVGDLNPEGIFVAGASPAGAAPAAASASPEDVVGIWVPRKLVNAARTLSGPILPILLPHLEDECSRLMPKHSDYDIIHRTYLEQIHPIIPVVDLNALRKQPDRQKVFLKLAICLSVAGNSKATTRLKQPAKDFTVQVVRLIRSAIDNGLVRDKQVIIQLLIILAFITQLSEDRHASAELTSRAISYIHTGGLQLDTAGRGDDAYVTRLFCCSFALDRLNAAVQGRPVIMHERDSGRDLDACIQRQEGLFQLFLRVILLMDKVISLYRPSLTGRNPATEVSHDFETTFPAFEDLLNSCGSIRAPAALVATVETLYHAVAMLSCRSQSLFEAARNTATHTRQSLSATSIMSIAGNEYRGQLSVLPFVPYALALALRVTYRDLRLSKSSFTRTRARRQLLHVCSLLRELGDMFPSSLHMADLAEQIVREIDKATSAAVVQQRRASVAPNALEDNRANRQAMQPIDQGNDELACTDSNVHDSLRENPAATTTFINPLQSYEIQAFNPSEFDFDLDIFDHFDPDFDISAIDAALFNSVDPSLPTNLVGWDEFSTESPLMRQQGQ